MYVSTSLPWTLGLDRVPIGKSPQLKPGYSMQYLRCCLAVSFLGLTNLGCTICESPYDSCYSAYGGICGRQGRVGSILDPVEATTDQEVQPSDGEEEFVQPDPEAFNGDTAQLSSEIYSDDTSGVSEDDLAEACLDAIFEVNEEDILNNDEENTCRDCEDKGSDTVADETLDIYSKET